MDEAKQTDAAVTAEARCYHNYIGGCWQPAAKGQTFANEDPATGVVLSAFPDSGPEDVAAAAAAAMAALPAWRSLPAPRRGEIIFRAARLLQERKEELARDLTLEMGKVIAEARGDVQEAIDMGYYMGGEGRRSFGHVVPSEMPNKFALATRAPKGVVAAITPWNFPIAIPSWKLFPALVCGNTAVFKPSQYSPKSAYNFVRILEEAGLPPGVINLVFGAGAEAGQLVVEQPQVAFVSFTGSNAVGTRVAVRCAQLGKGCHLELGGKNAIIVLDDADLDLALEGVIWSAFGTSGQRCTAASRVIVQSGVASRFTEMLVSRAQALRLGPGLDEATDVGPLINQPQLKKVESYIPVGVAEGATLACGGRVRRDHKLRGYFFEPTVFTNARPDVRIAQEEIFGPVTTLITVPDLEAAIKVNNSVRFGLSSSIYTCDVNRIFRAIERLDTGIVYVNHGTTGAEIQLPFGGSKATGNGHREAGQAALDTFTEWKSVYIDYSGRLQRAQIDTERPGE